MKDLDIDQLSNIIGKSKSAVILPSLNIALDRCACTTPLRAAAFIAQCAHETAEFKFSSEIWGPTEQQKKYEPPSDLAKRLGNTQPGDGYRYRGRGWLQTTGRHNYSELARALNMPLLEQPDLVSTPEVAGLAAAHYWISHDLNALADAGWPKFEALSIKINGGLNGIASRNMYYARAIAALLPRHK